MKLHFVYLFYIVALIKEKTEQLYFCTINLYDKEDVI